MVATAWGWKSEVGMQALSNLTATCSSIALGRDVAAAAFRPRPLALRRINFTSLGPSKQPPNGFDGVVFGRQAGKRVGCRRSAPADRPRTKRRRQRQAEEKTMELPSCEVRRPLAREAGEDGAAKPRQVRGTGNRRTLRPPSTPAVRRSQPSPGASRLSSPASRARDTRRLGSCIFKRIWIPA